MMVILKVTCHSSRLSLYPLVKIATLSLKIILKGEFTCPISYIGITPPPLFQDLAPPLVVVITPKYRTYTYHT